MNEFIVIDAVRIKKSLVSHYHKWNNEVYVYAIGEPLKFRHETEELALKKLFELDTIFGVIRDEFVANPQS